MKLSHLLSCLSVPVADLPDREITDITEDSRKCHAGALFVCVEGFRSDGHRYASAAYAAGCRAFVAQKELDLPRDAAVVLVESSQNALALLACRFYGDPSHRLTVLALRAPRERPPPR